MRRLSTYEFAELIFVMCTVYRLQLGQAMCISEKEGVSAKILVARCHCKGRLRIENYTAEGFPRIFWDYLTSTMVIHLARTAAGSRL